MDSRVPIDDHGHRRRVRLLDRIDQQEAAAVPANVEKARGVEARVKERLGRKSLKTGAGLYRGRHQLPIRGDIKQFLAVPAPNRAAASLDRNPPFSTERGKRLYVDLRVTGLVGGICQPSRIRRNLGPTLIELRLKQ